MLRCRHSEPRGCPGGVTFNHAPFFGGGVVGYLVPFRIPCRWEPGVPVRRLVLTRYVRNPACLGSVFLTKLPKDVVQHLQEKCSHDRSFAISCCASRQSVRGRWNDAHVLVRIGLFCVVARRLGGSRCLAAKDHNKVRTAHGLDFVEHTDSRQAHFT